MVKKLRMSKALTISKETSVSDACRRIATPCVDAVLLPDSNALLSGIMTAKFGDEEDCDEDMEEGCDHEEVEEGCDHEDVEEEQGDDQ
ncbi:CBS domain-containing protein CBSCBSPB2-like [Vicia villosa]|uniref:CBS domain-containing protein CBSCBSPB2-like n=1 Tax=Vicia villosa TaxID=3911 RepID=UPI00273B14F0|nr:CBS domain-containing protein CBSCBSPB2-like [Vicia villosa]